MSIQMEATKLNHEPNYVPTESNNDSHAEEAEVTVTASGPFGMSTAEFIAFLRKTNCNANVGTNPNYPGVVWMGLNPNNM